MRAFGIPRDSRAREPRESGGENRQADERMREAAMVARDGERIARERVDENVHVRENGAESGGENGDARGGVARPTRRIPLREKRLADERASDAVRDWVHDRIRVPAYFELVGRGLSLPRSGPKTRPYRSEQRMASP